MKKIDKSKAVKIAGYVINAVAVIICLIALVIAIGAITAKNKGYNSIFGVAYYAVGSGSMEGTAEDSFSEGDVIKSKVLKKSDLKDLKVGDVITFFDLIEGERALNTHRIVKINEEPVTGALSFQTKGDANAAEDDLWREEEDVIGLYQGKFNGFGKVLLWMQTETGFLVCVMIPSLIILVYCIVLVVINIINYRSGRQLRVAAAEREILEAQIREEMKAELLKELDKEKDAEDKG